MCVFVCAHACVHVCVSWCVHVCVCVCGVFCMRACVRVCVSAMRLKVEDNVTLRTYTRLILDTQRWVKAKYLNDTRQ